VQQHERRQRDRQQKQPEEQTAASGRGDTVGLTSIPSRRQTGYILLSAIAILSEAIDRFATIYYTQRGRSDLDPQSRAVLCDCNIVFTSRAEVEGVRQIRDDLFAAGG